MSCKAGICDLRDCWVDQVDVSLQGAWKRVFQGADGLPARRGVPEKSEVRVEHLVSFRHWDVNTEPVACGGYGCRCEAVIREPCVDSRHGVGFGSNEALNLDDSQLHTQQRRFMQQDSAHLLFGQVLPILFAIRIADAI